MGKIGVFLKKAWAIGHHWKVKIEESVIGVFLKRIWEKICLIKHHKKVLAVLAIATVIVLPLSTDIATIWHLLILMVTAYVLVGFGAMLNRSSTRNSWVYHGVVLLASSFAGYWVYKSVHELVSLIGITYFLFIVYITATAWGNFTGSSVSIFFEKILGVKARWKGKDEPPSRGEQRVKYALLIILGILAITTLIITRSNYVTAVYVLVLNSLNSGIHTFVRRSRNVGHTLFHNAGLLAQGLNFFFLFRFLVQEDMSWVFFLPYAMGSVLGGLLVQEFTKRVEAKIKADPDSHLTKEIKSSSRFPIALSLFPWKTLLALFITAVIVIFISELPLLIAIIIGVAVLQQTGFTLISRARTRKSRTYEAYASISSNGGWLVSFSKLDQYGWGVALFMPYIIGVMIGGNLGVGIAKHIEKWFGISSD